MPAECQELGLGDSQPCQQHTSGTAQAPPAMPSAQLWDPAPVPGGTQGCGARSSPTGNSSLPCQPREGCPSTQRDFREHSLARLPCWGGEVLPTHPRECSPKHSCVPSSGLFSKGRMCDMPGGSSSVPQCPSCAPHMSSEPGTARLSWAHPTKHIPHPTNTSQPQVLPSPGPALLAPPRAGTATAVSLHTLSSPGTKCKSVAVPASIKNFLKTEQNKQKKDFHHHLQIH